MHKPELAEAIALQAGLSKQAAAECLNVVLDEIVNALAFSRRIALSGLGVLAPVQRSVVFRPASKLRQALQETAEGNR